MKHVSRLGAIGALGLGLVLGCSGDDPQSDAPFDETPEGQAADELDADGFEISLTGQDIPMSARAELKVNEGERPVHLSITGRTSGSDVIVIDLTFDGVENAIGAHEVEFSLPDDGLHIANGSLAGTWYYSQGGTIEVTVDADGALEGQFSIALARGEMGEDPSQPVVFSPSNVTTQLDGAFDVPWTLNCHSRLAGHSTLIYGGDYCENLEL